MKKGAVLLFAVLFAVCLFHFYYAEDHCPAHCQAKSGGFGHVHPHHAGAGVCLCFWTSLIGPETCDIPVISGALDLLDRPAADRVLGPLATDVTPPPRPLLV